MNEKSFSIGDVLNDVLKILDQNIAYCQNRANAATDNSVSKWRYAGSVDTLELVKKQFQAMCDERSMHYEADGKR